MIHTCEGCGLVHDAAPQDAGSREDPAVAIARINAERDVQVAKLAARQERDWNETRVEVAEIEGETAAEVAAAEAEVAATIIGAEAGGEPDPEPVIIDAPSIEVSQEADPQELPPVEGSPAPEPESRRSRGLGMW